MDILTKESNPMRLSFMRLIFKNKGNINIFDYFQVKLISFEKAQESWQLDADAKLEQVSGWVEIISHRYNIASIVIINFGGFRPKFSKRRELNISK